MKHPFIVIEGTDGSGKATQFDLLAKKLAQEGHKVATFDFPQYDQDSSVFVREYLAGNYGSTEDVGPYTSSVFYALDRFSAKEAITTAIRDGYIVLANRFTASNMAHQGTKFADSKERRSYYIWLDNLEFEMFGIPRPTMNLVLRVDAKTSRTLMEERAKNDPTHITDIHEKNHEHLQKSVDVYDELCALFPQDFTRLDCVRSGKLLSIEQVHDLVWNTVSDYLPKPESKKGSVTKGSDLHEPYVAKDKAGNNVMTEAGKRFLEQAVTTTSGNVYGFFDSMSPITIAAAMARLSRRGDDMRITMLDEFANAATKKDEKLLQRVITAYGDDSVQQLVGQHFVVEGASNLLTKKIEWGRLGAYLEQSTRYIYFDQKNADGAYKYYIPEHFDAATRAQYIEKMDHIFDMYSMMVHKLTDYVREHSTTPKAERDIAWQGATRAQACDAVRPVLPVAVQATVGLFLSGQALESLIMHLLSDELPEARATGELLLKEGRKVAATFLERADKPDRGGARIAYSANTYKAVKTLAEAYLQSPKDNKHEAVTLVSVWPRNELDTVADILYEHSNHSLKELQKQVDGWSIDKKTEVLNAYIGERLNRRHKPGRALEKVHYSWDLLCDYGIFRDLQRHRMVDDLTWQQLTPRYGFDVPELVEQAGLTEVYEACFAVSLELHSLLVENGYQTEAQYATLLGHKMRWKITYNAREAFHLHELRTTPHGHPGYRKLVLEMHEKLTQVHPILGAAMKFVNKDEDPELTRLAAERYTQFKLSQI